MTEKASFPAAIDWATVLILCHVVKSLKLIFFSETHLNIDDLPVSDLQLSCKVLPKRSIGQQGDTAWHGSFFILQCRAVIMR